MNILSFERAEILILSSPGDYNIADNGLTKMLTA
jgi:hypothetical protein